jgi:hypothetical protein
MHHQELRNGARRDGFAAVAAAVSEVAPSGVGADVARLTEVPVGSAELAAVITEAAGHGSCTSDLSSVARTSVVAQMSTAVRVMANQDRARVKAGS